MERIPKDHGSKLVIQVVEAMLEMKDTKDADKKNDLEVRAVITDYKVDGKLFDFKT